MNNLSKKLTCNQLPNVHFDHIIFLLMANNLPHKPCVKKNLSKLSI